jgi:glycosyltransferase involved in cell wall biosynthesis
VRVLWLTRGLGLSGTTRLLLACARHLDRDRFEVEVAHTVPGEDALADELEKAGVAVHCLTGRPERRGRDPLWPLRLRALLARRRYALVHTHAPWPAVAARLLLRGRDAVPLVHSEYDVRGHRALTTRLADTATYRRNRAVLAGSRAVAESLRPPRGADPGSWLTVVRHTPELPAAPAGDEARAAARAEARRALGVPAGAVAVGTVGSLTARKEIGVLLDAFTLLRRSHPGTVLVLVGTGPREKRLREYAAGRGLGDAVVFAGARPDAPAVLPALDVFALTSRREALPVPLMEAMAAGLPSVVTRVDAVPEVVDQGVEALMVQPGDHEALAIALGRLVGGPALRARMAAAARERARGFDPAGVQRVVEGVYERVLTAFQAEVLRAEAVESEAVEAEAAGKTAAGTIPDPAKDPEGDPEEVMHPESATEAEESGDEGAHAGAADPAK